MYRLLGCNLNTTSCQTYFSHPIIHKKVIMFLDLCQSLKLLRNCFGEHKSIIDNNDLIQWEYFTKLYHIQINESLHLDNKLRAQHIKYYKQKMKVKFAYKPLMPS